MVRNITRPLAHLTRATEDMSKLGNELLAFSCADMKSNTVKLEKMSLLPAGQAAVKRKTTTAGRVQDRPSKDGLNQPRRSAMSCNRTTC